MVATLALPEVEISPAQLAAEEMLLVVEARTCRFVQVAREEATLKRIPVAAFSREGLSLAISHQEVEVNLKLLKFQV